MDTGGGFQHLDAQIWIVKCRYMDIIMHAEAICHWWIWMLYSYCPEFVWIIKMSHADHKHEAWIQTRLKSTNTLAALWGYVYLGTAVLWAKSCLAGILFVVFTILVCRVSMLTFKTKSTAEAEGNFGTTSDFDLIMAVAAMITNFCLHCSYKL